MYKIIERLAEEKGMTMADLSAKSGVAQNVLSNLKARGGNLSIQNAMKIATALDVDLIELVREEE